MELDSSLKTGMLFTIYEAESKYNEEYGSNLPHLLDRVIFLQQDTKNKASEPRFIFRRNSILL